MPTETDVGIEEVTPGTMPAARALVDRVFRGQGPFASAFFRACEHRDSRLARAYLWLAGMSEVTGLWVALDSDGAVIGASALCRRREGPHDSLWLSWLCVAPESRRGGVGGRLLDFTIEKARASRAAFLRLHTSDLPNEAPAQSLYESRGLRVCRTHDRVFYRLIERELQL